MFIWSLESSKYDISTCHHVNSNETCDKVVWEKSKLSTLKPTEKRIFYDIIKEIFLAIFMVVLALWPYVPSLTIWFML